MCTVILWMSLCNLEVRWAMQLLRMSSTGLTANRAAVMVSAFWLRGTRSMRMSLMSRRMARVVSSTSAANTKVQMGSASDHRGSSCKAAQQDHISYI